MNETLRTYDISFDQEKSREIGVNSSLEEQLRQKEAFSAYVTSQMETHLGERFNVGISTFSYDIKNGELWGRDMEEPFVKSLKRGRDYRKLHGNEVDQRREEAEVKGFEKIQNVLTDENIPIGTMMLSVSPPGLRGSTYTHNFYDVFTVYSREESDQRFIEARRYASALSTEEYSDKIGAFTRINIDESDPAASFLENPIPITNALTAKDIHAYLHKDHEYMGSNQFEVIKRSCSELIKAYTEGVIKQPDNNILHKILFNTILNKADELAEMIEMKGAEQAESEQNIRFVLKDEIEKYAFLPVRQTMTGCGFSGGYGIAVEQMGSPFSVSYYAPDRYGERTFNCPTCKKENVRPLNTLLPQCQHCKSTKVAC
jgi:hypothetical protein